MGNGYLVVELRSPCFGSPLAYSCILEQDTLSLHSTGYFLGSVLTCVIKLYHRLEDAICKYCYIYVFAMIFRLKAFSVCMLLVDAHKQTQFFKMFILYVCKKIFIVLLCK